MPEPRPLGNSARAIVASVADMLATQQDAYFEIVLLLNEGDVSGAIKGLMGLAQSNSLELRVLTLLLADRPAEAEAILMDAKIRKDKK